MQSSPLPMHDVDQIEVGLKPNGYPIFVGRGIRAQLSSFLRGVSFPKKVAVITNDLVCSLHGDAIVTGLVADGFTVDTIKIGDGENFKTLETLSSVYDRLVACDMDRSGGIIALGGGVVGDLAGYAAASYMRGIAFVQVPTTLLAQVDSSVGGKTAVNHPLGKNIIGAFYQPKLVCIDVDVLQTLQDREFRAGLSEVVKYGVIRNAEFFNWLSDHADALLARDPEALIHAIKTSCQIKADIVEIDEKESGIRAFLNLGHTFGHAVESLTHYQRYLHGEAVAIGMVVAAEISSRLGMCTSQDVAAIRNLLQRFNLPVTAPAFTLDDYVGAMMHDKKVKQGVLRMVLNRGIGECEIVDVEDPASTLSQVLQTCIGS